MTPNELNEAVLALNKIFSNPGRMERLKDVETEFVSAERAVRVAMAAISRNPQLVQAARMSPLSFFEAVMGGIEMGLEPGGRAGLAYLVPRRNKKTGRTEITLLVGYRGLMSIVRRSTEIGAIEADVVYPTDIFSFERGSARGLRHVPNLDIPRDAPGDFRLAYAAAYTRAGQLIDAAIMTREQIDQIRKRSEAGESAFSPWNSKFGGDQLEMCKKTALRRLCKMLPLEPVIATQVGTADKFDPIGETFATAAAPAAEARQTPASRTEAVKEAIARSGGAQTPPAPAPEPEPEEEPQVNPEDEELVRELDDLIAQGNTRTASQGKP